MIRVLSLQLAISLAVERCVAGGKKSNSCLYVYKLIATLEVIEMIKLEYIVPSVDVRTLCSMAGV